MCRTVRELIMGIISRFLVTSSGREREREREILQIRDFGLDLA